MLILLFSLLMGALFYSVAERNVSHKRNGAMHFFRVGRLSGSFVIRKRGN